MPLSSLAFSLIESPARRCTIDPFQPRKATHGTHPGQTFPMAVCVSRSSGEGGGVKGQGELSNNDTREWILGSIFLHRMHVLAREESYKKSSHSQGSE
jgi:hypothetical protein